MLASRLASGSVRVFAVAAVMFLAIIYLKLGYFVIFLLPLGALAAVLITRKQRAGYSPLWSSLAVIVAYGAAYALVLSVAIQNRDETRELAWEVLEVPGQSGPEVRLYLGGSDYLLSHSSEFARYLRSQADETVSVSLPVTRILGCFQSVGVPRVKGWGVLSLDGYASVGSGVGPWVQHWWCP